MGKSLRSIFETFHWNSNNVLLIPAVILILHYIFNFFLSKFIQNAKIIKNASEKPHIGYSLKSIGDIEIVNYFFE